MDGETKQQHLLHAGYKIILFANLWLRPNGCQDKMTLDEAWDDFTNPPVSDEVAAKYGNDPLTNAALDRLQDDLRDGDDRQGGVTV